MSDEKRLAFHKVVRRHFLGEVDKFKTLCVKCIQNFKYQKSLKSFHFWLSYSKYTNVMTFLKHGVAHQRSSRLHYTQAACSYRSWRPSHQMVALRRNKLHDRHSMCHVVVCQVAQQSIRRRHYCVADVGMKLSFIEKLDVIDTLSWIVWNVLCCPVEIAS